MDLIDRQKAIEALRRDPMGGLNYAGILKRLPTVEIDEDMIIEYCRKRCLVIMTAELFADWFMNKRIEDAYDGSD